MTGRNLLCASGEDETEAREAAEEEYSAMWALRITNVMAPYIYIVYKHTYICRFVCSRCIYIYVYVSVYLHTHENMHVYVCVYIYICMYVRVRMCVYCILTIALVPDTSSKPNN